MEILVSLILIVLILQLTCIIASASNQIVQARHHTTASCYAVSLIESIRTDINFETGHYCIPAGGSFNLLNAPSNMEAEVIATPVQDNPELYLVGITVYWQERGQTQQMEIESIVRKDFR